MALELDAALLEPIPGDNPAGENIRYEPIFDEIKLAREEEEDLPQGDWSRERKTADYRLVIKQATDVLAKRSKDLQITAWLTEALTHREGAAGLHAGLELVRELLERFWDHAYPEIEDGDLGVRAAPLEWLGLYLGDAVRRIPLSKDGYDQIAYHDSRLIPTEEEAEADQEKLETRNSALEEGKLTPEAFEDSFLKTPKSFYKELVAGLNGALASVDALDAIGQERFEDPDDRPGYYRLRETLSQVTKVASQLLEKKLELDPDPVEAVPLDVTGSGDATAEAGAPVSVEPRDWEDAASRVAAAAKFMRAHRPTDPAPYVMLRALRWGELRADGGKINPKMLAAPPTNVRTRLKSMLLDAQWADLLEACENVMATPFGRGWLDLQRYVFTACAGLGDEYENVTSTMRGELRSLLQDLPGLIDMTLMDDSPTANAETRGWLAETGVLGEAAEAAAAEPSVSVGVKHGRDPLDIAEDRVRAGEPKKGIELLMREAQQEKSERARFVRRSQATRIMVDNGLESVAMPILQELAALVDKHALEEWEDGETVAQPLGLLYRCMERLGVDSGDKEQLYLRVCRLDPLQAMSFTANAQPEQSDDAAAGD